MSAGPDFLVSVDNEGQCSNFAGDSSIHVPASIPVRQGDTPSGPLICDDLDQTTPGDHTAVLARWQTAASRKPLQVGGHMGGVGVAETVQLGR